MIGTIAGIVNFDGKPVDNGLVERMLSSGSVSHTQTNVAYFGQAAIGASDHRPYKSNNQSTAISTNNLAIAWTGRLDNKKEILSRLGIPNVEHSSILDAKALLYSYRKWNDRCVEKFVGEFTFAIWDRKNKKVLCAVDHYSSLPLFYYSDNKTLIFGSRIVQLYQNSCIPYNIDQNIVYEVFNPWRALMEGTKNECITGYKGIIRLPHGCILSRCKEKVDIKKYWNIAPEKKLVYSNQSDYYEQFEEIFREAVSCRLNTSQKKIGFELTGGLDSSSVVMMAYDIFKKGQARNKEITTFTINFEDLSCNEKPYADIVIKACQAEGVYLTGDWLLGEWNLPIGTQKPFDFYTIESKNIPRNLESIFQAAYERGIDTILTGHAADFYLEGNELIFDSFIRKFNLMKFFKEFKSALFGTNLQQKFSGFCNYVIAPFFPKNLSMLGFYELMYPQPTGEEFPEFFCSPFRDKLQNERVEYSSIPWMKTWGQQDDYVTLFPPVHFEELSNLPINRTNPYLDKRLIEFGMAIPPEIKFSYTVGKTRYRRSKLLQRNGLSNILPDSIRLRNQKTTYGDALVRFFELYGNDVRNLFNRRKNSILLYEYEYLKPEKFEQALENLLACPQKCLSDEETDSVWIRQAIRTEIWLRTFLSPETQSSLMLKS